MERFNWHETKHYWEGQRVRAGAIDDNVDPDLLGNVCHAGAPIWFNDYYARYQRAIYEELLGRTGLGSRAHALDVGCGAGRWCRLLAEKGFLVEGIDLQEALLEVARQRYPDVRFHHVPVQEFTPERPFELVSTVTVLQHLPPDEQRRAIGNIARLLVPGGYALCLENISDQSLHVFANSRAEWERSFAAAGLSLIRSKRYDYSPFIRLSTGVMGAASALARRLGVSATPPDLGVPRATEDEPGREPDIRRFARSAAWMVRRVATSLDDRLEPLLIRWNVDVPTVHCGFLFQKGS